MDFFCIMKADSGFKVEPLQIPLIRPADPGITVQRVFVVSKLGVQYQICRQHNLPCCEFCKRLGRQFDLIGKIQGELDFRCLEILG